MRDEMGIRKNGELRDWLHRFSFSGVDDISLKQYKDMIEKGLQMSANDLMKLIRVAGFDDLKSKDKKMKIETVAKNIEKRLAESTAERDRAIKKVADQMVKKGFDLQQAMRYFDTDGSGEITREELKDGFDNMNIPLSEALRNNLFVILDGTGDNEISVTEFEAVFAKYLGAGGPV
jgi:Ca2+-binding EF-hand superfamily protein